MRNLHLAALLALILPTLAFAGEPADCNGSCDEGSVLVSFTDGNTVSCSCETKVPMDETVPNPDMHEGEVNQQD